MKERKGKVGKVVMGEAGRQILKGQEMYLSSKTFSQQKIIYIGERTGGGVRQK